jgi:hypothetical protein
MLSDLSAGAGVAAVTGEADPTSRRDARNWRRHPGIDAIQRGRTPGQALPAQMLPPRHA